MKYWLIIKDKLNNQTELGKQLLLLLLGVYIFIMAQEHIIWKAPILFIGLLFLLLLRDKTKHPIVWILGFVLLLIDLFLSYFWVANHHFMILFVVVSVISLSYHNSEEILLKNIQIILVIVVLSSVLQKLMSNQFVNGDFYYYMINRGTFFSHFFKFSPEIMEVVNSNQQALLALHSGDPNLEQQIVLTNVVTNLRAISIVYAWITVVIESLVALAFIYKPHSIMTHILFIVMILGILCARFETGFMCLLAICGIFLCNNSKIKLLYTTITVACIAFIITKLGYH